MKMYKLFIIFILAVSTYKIFAQFNDPFLEDYHFFKNKNSGQAKEYVDISGSPYLNPEFSEGIFYLKDSTIFRLPARYNIYSDEMEYQREGINYAINDPNSLYRIHIGKSVFIFLNSNLGRGYYELLENGKFSLLQKREVSFRPEEGPKPIEGTVKPATFIKGTDTFYILSGDTDPKKILNLKSLIKDMDDHKMEIENFIKKEKIKKAKKENLIKIVNYYNSLL